jgi:hypothetical protein
MEINRFNNYVVGNRAGDQLMRELGLVRSPVKLKYRISIRPIASPRKLRTYVLIGSVVIFVVSKVAMVAVVVMVAHCMNEVWNVLVCEGGE